MAPLVRVIQVALQLAVLAVPATSSAQAGFDFRRAVESQPAFASPVVLRTQFNPNSSNLGGSCIASYLLQNGKLTFQPAEARPHWRPVLANGTADTNGISLPMGYRRVNSVTELRRWSEGAWQFQAATVNYSIIDTGAYGRAGTPYGPIAVRMTYQYHPSTNRWVLSSEGSPYNSESENAQISQEAFSTCNLGAVEASISGAVRRANASAEVAIAEHQGVRTTSSPNVIESTSAGIAVYMSFEETTSLRGIQLNQVLPRVQRMCSDLVVGEWSDWRVPRYADFRAITRNGRRPSERVPVDTPDQRIWGPFLRSLNGTDQTWMVVSDPNAQTWGPINGLATRNGRAFDEAGMLPHYMNIARFRLACVHDL